MQLSYSKYFILLLTLGLSIVTFSCNLEKDLDINLPTLKPQLVVESYLEPGMPYRLALTESTEFLADPRPILVTDATVIIFHNGQPDTLKFATTYDTLNQKVYTHTSKTIMRGRPGDVYTLQITDKSNRTLTGTTTVLPAVPIDTIEYSYNNQGKAFLVAKFKDSINIQNFYRFSVYNGTKRDRVVDYPADDTFGSSEGFAFGTGFDFEKNDTALVTLYHLEKPFFDFVSSVDNAKEANGNPFAQPAGVKSTVQGGLGVFTTLVYDRKIIILK